MTISEEKNNSIIVIEANKNYFGCLHLMKTNISNPIDGMYYTILTPTSDVDKNNLRNLSVKQPQSILYFQYSQSLVDYHPNKQVKNTRKPLIKLDNDLYIPKEKFLDTTNALGRKITLLQANIKINPSLTKRILNTLKVQGR
jgi:hypothetical protein